MKRSLGTLGSLALALSVVVAAPAWAQERVGIVTSVVGPVTVTRASLPDAPLKFKDDIFLRDRVTTGDNAMTRILMGGKVIVTARERSTLTITEVPGLSTIDLTSGRIAVAVDKMRMKPGERVDVRTPNAIAGVRGTVLVVETHGATSSVTVLTGLVDVVRLDPATGRPVGPVTAVGAQQVVTIRNNVLPPRPHAIAPQRSRRLSEEFTLPMRSVSATAVMPVEEEVARATTLLNELLPGSSPNPGSVAGVNTGAVDAAVPAARPGATLGDSSVSKPTSTPVSTTTPLPTTSLTAPALASPAPSTLPTTTLPTTTLPTTTPTATNPSLLQSVVQPVVQTVTNPLSKLLK